MSRSILPRSIERRLPVLVTLLLVAVLVVFAALAYVEVRSALVHSAEVRLETAAERLGDLLAAGPADRRATLAGLGERPEITALAQGGGTAAAAEAVLDSVSRTETPPTALLLVTPDSLLLAVGEPSLPVERSRPSPVGPLIRTPEGLGYTLSVPVLAGGDTIAHLVEVQAISFDPESSRTIADLIGREATFLFGNASGDVWTDLGGVTTGPSTSLPRGEMVATDAADGGQVLGRLSAVPGTPWVHWVALPRAGVMEPLRALLGRMAAAMVLLVALGGAGAWVMGHRIATPLGELTRAAEKIARGDHSDRVEARGDEELVRLADSFNEMAHEVEKAKIRLEDRVRERTAELEDALADLEDAQEELVRKERLALLGELAGGVGHELRNPLGVMTNAVFYLDAVLQDKPEKVGEYLEILTRQIHISEKIVSDLLDFARVRPPELRPTHLRALVEEQLERGPRSEALSTEWDFPAGLPPARIDKDQVGQVVLNLVTNAIQAMDEAGGGVLTLRGRADDGQVTLEVADTGPGMDPETAAKVFEPLFTTKAKGIGLGLSVSRSLAEANAGVLTLETAAGEGATFRLTLPAAES